MTRKHLSPQQPPRWADWILEWFVAPHLLEYVQGDLHEAFYKQVAQVGLVRARRDYVWAVLHCLTPFFARRQKNDVRKAKLNPSHYNAYSKPFFMDMLSNYLTIAFRNLWRHKAFTAINSIGLAVGLATCLLIALFVLHELSYDRYHSHAERLYRMTLHTRLGEKDINYAYSAEPAGPALLRDYLGVEAITRLRDDGDFLVKNGEETFKEGHVAFVDSNFFSIFSIPLIKGHRASVLVDPKTLVLTQTTARKYFGQADPIGKTLSVGNLGVFRVTGVCADIPSNTHFHYDLFGSFPSVNQGVKWLASGAYTYVLLRDGYSIQQVEAQSQGFLRKYMASEIKEFLGIDLPEFLQKGNRLGFGFQPVTTIHLYSDLDDELEANGDIKYVYIFTVIALFILLLACINFMNLSTVGSAGRAKEVGVRKVMGSVKSQLVSQFLTESVLLTLLALLLALGLVFLVLPGFNALAGKQFTLGEIANGWLLSGAVVTCLVIGLLAGSYPAFVLSSFKPITVLNGKSEAGLRSGWLRNALVTGQFTVSIGILIATIVANQQLRFMQDKKVGFDKEQVLVLHDTHVLGSKLNAFKAELARMSSVVKISLAGFLPAGTSKQSQDGILIKDGSKTAAYTTKSYFVDEDYLSTLGMQLAQGRNFSEAFPADNSSVLLNEAAVRAYGFKTPIGQQISITGDGSEASKHTYTVIGVVKDFHFESMRHRIAPLIMFYGGDNSQLALRIRTDNVSRLLTTIEQRWKAETGDPFAYSFLNERFNTLYQSEQRIGQLFGVFAGLAVLISCLGLLGLAAFTTHQRTKEIGVRKVLGASVTGIVKLLLTNYLKLILIAMVIASPIAGYIMNQWLGDFAYRIDISWWIFVLAGGLATTVAILTVSYQAIKAALMNPVKSLRTE
ncbi:FtsX-like permease family protein [Spirosoma sp. KCTC 42546]|uniref:ABC transporter permease n=1 Tax=Spirosoma sp. KCTC 42546 TaxID=2520506 RepID=UPI00115871EC|nr:ABC transporter permease [Spirosoma sp. KCTC 42546]QDK82211.1 FtsX-like permease family protein [Spirosoma sp. KCTC 42546]